MVFYLPPAGKLQLALCQRHFDMCVSIYVHCQLSQVLVITYQFIRSHVDNQNIHKWSHIWSVIALIESSSAPAALAEHIRLSQYRSIFNLYGTQTVAIVDSNLT